MWQNGWPARTNLTKARNFQQKSSISHCLISFKKFSHWEAFVQRCSQKKVFWKYAANLQENTWSAISMKLLWNFTCFATWRITLLLGFSSANLLRTFRTLFSKSTYRWLLLYSEPGINLKKEKTSKREAIEGLIQNFLCDPNCGFFSLFLFFVEFSVICGN